MSAKYPRTPHLPWSPGGTSDDKRMSSVESLIGVDLVVTEKLDGSNMALAHDKIFARSHAKMPSHRSFDFAKSIHAQLKSRIEQGITIFCEYCYAVHSIEYSALWGYVHVFGVRDDLEGTWESWEGVEAVASDLSLPTAPVLHRGVVSSESELIELTNHLGSLPSFYGGTREGVVVRRVASFRDFDFPGSVAKWVRKDHVQTEVHWSKGPIRKQNVS